MRIKSYLEFINESEMEEFTGLTALPATEAADTFYKITDPVLNTPKEGKLYNTIRSTKNKRI
jgi:hypothetical protein